MKKSEFKRKLQQFLKTQLKANDLQTKIIDELTSRGSYNEDLNFSVMSVCEPNNWIDSCLEEFEKQNGKLSKHGRGKKD